MTDIEKMVASSKQTAYMDKVAWKVPDGTCTTNFQLACRCWEHFLNGCTRTNEWKINAALCRPVKTVTSQGVDMTVEEYNREFLPKIQRAKEFITLFESSIQHMDDKTVDKDEVLKQFKVRGWSEETRETILTALSYYNQHEGFDKIYR